MIHDTASTLAGRSGSRCPHATPDERVVGLAAGDRVDVGTSLGSPDRFGPHNEGARRLVPGLWAGPVTGPAVVVDVLQALTTAAYAFAEGPWGGQRHPCPPPVVRQSRLRHRNRGSGERQRSGKSNSVITLWHNAEHGGEDDLHIAPLVERSRRGHSLNTECTVAAVAASHRAAVTFGLWPGNADSCDVDMATRVNALDCAMEAETTGGRILLRMRRGVDRPPASRCDC